jgi:hypothetical protein
MTTLQCKKKRSPGLYAKLRVLDNKWTSLIWVDVPRTFSAGQIKTDESLTKLGNVLNAYANLNPEVGYCQGMNFLAGLLITVSESSNSSSEEDVFWMFVSLMEYDGLRDFYKEGFPMLLRYSSVFLDLLRRDAPDLFSHFQTEGVAPSLYLHQWFLSLFINCLPLETVLIIWDSIICDGLPVAISISIALLKVLRNILIKLEFELIVKFFKSMKKSENSSDSQIIGILLIKQSALIDLNDGILKKLSSPIIHIPPPAPPPAVSFDPSPDSPTVTGGLSGYFTQFSPEQPSAASPPREKRLHRQ